MNKYKKLVSNTLIFAIGSFGSKILLLLLTRLYTGNINPGDNSTKELLEQTANFLIPIITFSIADAVIRYGIDKNFDNRKVFTSACVTEAFGIGVLLLLSPLLNFLPYTEGYVVLLVIYCITSGFRQIASQFVRARGLVRLFAMDGILATLTLFIFNVTFIAGFHLGVTGFLISVILSDLLSGLFLWGVAGLHRFFRLRYMDKKILRMMLQFSIPLIPSALLWLVTGFSDRLFVRYMSGPAGLVGETAAGIYGVSTKIPNLISTISTIFSRRGICPPSKRTTPRTAAGSIIGYSTHTSRLCLSPAPDSLSLCGSSPTSLLTPTRIRNMPLHLRIRRC